MSTTSASTSQGTISTTTSFPPSTETEATTTTTTSELYPSTSTSEIISPTASDSTTTTPDSTTTPITSTTSEPYTSFSSSTITTASSTTTSYSTTTSWTYTRPTTTTSVGPIIPPTPSSDSDALSTGAIVAIVVASVVGIIALALVTFLVVRRRRRNRDSVYYQNTPPMRETRTNNYGGDGGGGGGRVNNNNSGTGLGITSSDTNPPYGGNDHGMSQDQMNASSLDNGGGFSSQSTGFGYDNGVIPGTALGAGMYGYDDDYHYQQQAIYQQTAQQPFYPLNNNQPLSYTPPTEPDTAPEDRYDPTYGSRREQEAAYMNSEQQQLYLQSQQQLQQQQQQQLQHQQQQQQQQKRQQQYLAGQLPISAPVILPTANETFDTRPTWIGDGNQEGYYPNNRFSVNSQAYLEQLRQSYPPATIDQELMGVPPAEGGAGNDIVNNNVRTVSPCLGFPPLPPSVPVPQISSHVGAGNAGNTTGSEDYAYPESDARRVPPNDRRPSSSRPISSSTVVTPAQADVQDRGQHVVNNDATAVANSTQGELTPPKQFTEGERGSATEGNSNNSDNVGSPKQSSVLSQASSTVSNSLNTKRLNSPQVIPSTNPLLLFPSPKRGPQTRDPEEEPTVTVIRKPL